MYMDTLSQLQRYISLIPHPCGQNIFVCAESEIFFYPCSFSPWTPAAKYSKNRTRKKKELKFRS